MINSAEQSRGAPIVRLATEADLAAINDIYNYYVLHSTATYQIDPATAQERRAWFSAHGAKHPITVIEYAGGPVAGWASLSPFHSRAAFARTVENSVYVDCARQRQGLGKILLADSIDRARALKHHTIIAAIDSAQAGSLALHQLMGFTEAGHLKEAGFKFGRWLDVVYLQLML